MCRYTVLTLGQLGARGQREGGVSVNLHRYRAMWGTATAHLRETGAGVAFVVGLVWKHAPVAGSLLAVSTSRGGCHHAAGGLVRYRAD